MSGVMDETEEFHLIEYSRNETELYEKSRCLKVCYMK